MSDDAPDSPLSDLLEEALSEEAIPAVRLPTGRPAKPAAPEPDPPPAPVTKEEIAGAEEPAALEELAGRWQARHDGLLRFYGPLLGLLAAGKTTAPVDDLRQAARSGELLAAALRDAESPLGDDIARAAARLLARIPEHLPSANAASRFEKSHPPAPVAAPAPSSRSTAPDDDESAHRGVRYLVDAVVLVLFVGALSFVLGPRPPVAPLETYKDTVPEVLDKSMSGDRLLFTVGVDWDRLDAGQQAERVLQLLELASGEPYNTVEVRGYDGRTRARVTLDGSVELVERRGH